MRAGLFAIASALVVLAATGCGAEKTYVAASTKACLNNAGVKTVPVGNTDLVASSASGGAFIANLTKNQVTVSFAADATKATELTAGYARLTPPKMLQYLTTTLLERHGNTVLRWQLPPTSSQAAQVRSCLK